MKFTELNTKLTGRNKDRRKEGNNTYWERRGENIALKYHNTDVATFFPNGDVKLDSGGWITSTTKERLNWALGGTGFAISQSNKVWYLYDNRKDYWDDSKRIRYQDDITIHADGSVTGGIVETPEKLKADAKIKKAVSRYAQLCADSVPIDQPSGGDCWDCSFMTEDGKTMGELSHSDHIKRHVKEGYVVPTLVAQALKLYYNAPAAFWEAFKDTGWTHDREFGKRAVKKAVYRFVIKEYGFANK